MHSSTFLKKNDPLNPKNKLNYIRHLVQEAPLPKARRNASFLSETVSPVSSLRTYLNWNVRHSFFEVNIFLRIPCYNFLVRTIIIRLFFSAERSLLFLVIRKFLQIPLNWSFAAFAKVVVGEVDASIHEDEVFWALGRS